MACLLTFFMFALVGHLKGGVRWQEISKWRAKKRNGKGSPLGFEQSSHQALSKPYSTIQWMP